jgi:hypothetical protein
MLAFLAAIRIFFRTRLDISLEVLALRQQVAVLKRKRPRPSLNRLDRFFWTTLRQIWPRWSDVQRGEQIWGPMGGELFQAAVGGCFMSNLLAAIASRDAGISDVRAEVTALSPIRRPDLLRWRCA